MPSFPASQIQHINKAEYSSWYFAMGKGIFFIKKPLYKTSEIYYFLIIIAISDNEFKNLGKMDEFLENKNYLKWLNKK